MSDFQEVEVNGEILEFPASMSDAEIKAVLDKEFGTPAPVDTGMRGFPSGQQPKFGLGDLAETVGGIGEVGLQLGTGAVASALGGLAGIGAAIPGGKTPAEAVSGVQEALTYQPRLPEGQLLSQSLGDAFSVMDEKVDRFAESMGDPDDVLGATLLKTAILGAPSAFGFRPRSGGALSNKQQIATEAQSKGYTFPTSDTAGGVGRGVVEGMAGKPRIQQQASFRNQNITNELAARELGLPPGTEVTVESLRALRSELGRSYSVLDNAGTITTTNQYVLALNTATNKLRQIAKDFPGLAKKDGPVDEAISIAKSLNTRTFDASSVAPTTRLLRDMADAAFDARQKSLGNAYRDMAKALEDAAELHLQRFGDPDAVAAFQNARQQIAKSYSVQEALDGDGFVSAPKLAAQRKRGAPLSGDLELIARIAEQFPKSMRVIKEAPIEIGRLSGILGTIGTGGAAMAGGGLPAAVMASAAFGGPIVRRLMLSRAGQNLLGSSTPSRLNPAIAGSSGPLAQSELRPEDRK